MNNNKGYTLIEVISSIAILLMLGTIFFQFFISSQQTTTSNKEKLVAVNHSQLVLEEIKAGEYANVISGSQMEPYDYTYCLHVSKATEDDCKQLFKKEIAGSTYEVVIFVHETNEVGLYPIEVEIHSNGNRIQTSTVKGLVEL